MAAAADPRSSQQKQPAPEPTSRQQRTESFQGVKKGPFEVSIGSLDDSSLTVYAQYRPKELQVDHSMPWTKHGNKNAKDSLQLEFSGAEGRISTLELFFDASEIPDDSVEDAIQTLVKLTRIRDPKSSKDEMKRPHHCVLVFGRVYNTENSFPCVIETMSTKYTMFSEAGDPIRATVNLKLRETNLVDGPGGKDAATKAKENEARERENAKLA